LSGLLNYYPIQKKSALIRLRKIPELQDLSAGTIRFPSVAELLIRLSPDYKACLSVPGAFSVLKNTVEFANCELMRKISFARTFRLSECKAELVRALLSVRND
jgi:hypothetical protein